MFEKVNPSHPDKLADRIGGAIVDLGYKMQENPKIAGECLLGHGNCHIIIETSVDYKKRDIDDIVHRIAGDSVCVDLQVVPQDQHLADNQSNEIKCGDNGIFKGAKTNTEETILSQIVRDLYINHPFDGKFIYDFERDLLIACQSNIDEEKLKSELGKYALRQIIVNPLGFWTGGPDVDTGACNRKLGSDLGRAVTGGGLHFKDISKADVAVNVYLTQLCKKSGVKYMEASCAIGDTTVVLNGSERVSYKEITALAFDYIMNIGGFEKLAEWGLI